MAGLPEITIPEQTCCLGLEKDIWSYIGHKEKISQTKTGKKMSQEFVDNLKAKMAGELNPMFGRGHSEAARQKIAICSKLHAANKRGDTALILELQEEYFVIYGKYNDKYPYKAGE